MTIKQILYLINWMIKALELTGLCKMGKSLHDDLYRFKKDLEKGE